MTLFGSGRRYVCICLYGIGGGGGVVVVVTAATIAVAAAAIFSILISIRLNSKCVLENSCCCY